MCEGGFGHIAYANRAKKGCIWVRKNISAHQKRPEISSHPNFKLLWWMKANLYYCLGDIFGRDKVITEHLYQIGGDAIININKPTPNKDFGKINELFFLADV